MNHALAPALALSLAVALTPASAHANDGAFYGTGATVFPVADDAIALDEETLTIRQTGPTVGYYVDHWQVEVVYVFRNTKDAPVTVQMGFPEWCVSTPENYEDLPAKCSEWTIEDFTVQVDGKPVKATVKRTTPGKDTLADMDYHRAHTFPVSFAAKQSRTVRHTYRHRGGIVSPWCSDMTYILKTGALWQGAIKKLEISVEVIDRFKSREMVDPGTTEEGKLPPPKVEATAGGEILRWSLTDHEPKKDLAVLYCEPDAFARTEAISEVMALEESELRAMDKAALRVRRNTIYAAYGYGFKDADLRAHFAAVPWYRERADYDAKWIRREHMQRVALIKKIEGEKAKGK